jgi:acyl-CoA reductase-like NAD-dependent aldehyde dehydrogenase
MVQIRWEKRRRWNRPRRRERAEYLQRIAQLVRADTERLSRLISHEEGKPLRESRVEIEGWTAGFFGYFATFARGSWRDPPVGQSR